MIEPIVSELQRQRIHYSAVRERLMGDVPNQVPRRLLDALKAREDALCAREAVVEGKSLALAERENGVCLREHCLDEKFARYFDRLAALDRREAALAAEKQKLGAAQDRLRRAEGRARHAISLIDEPSLVAPHNRMQLKDILYLVSRRWELPENMILSHARPAKLVPPRCAFAVLAREFTMRTLTEIGRAMDGRDHSTIYYYIKITAGTVTQIRSRLGPDASPQQWLDALFDELAGRR